jgi:hypothetical protein
MGLCRCLMASNQGRMIYSAKLRKFLFSIANRDQHRKTAVNVTFLAEMHGDGKIMLLFNHYDV